MTERVDIHIPQGADYRVDIPALDDDGRPRNLAGWKARAAIRHSPDTELLAEPTVEVKPGRVVLVIPGAESAGWDWTRARWEVSLTGPRGQLERLVVGRVWVDRTLLR